VLLWELLPRFDVVDRQFIPSLSQVLTFLGKMAANGILFLHIAASLQRIFLGLLCYCCYRARSFFIRRFSPALSRHLNPLFRLLEQVNVLALYLIFILFFGIGETVKVMIIFGSTVWPILFTTITGV
jgi:NitT/TauT family transport system permease protein